jgi:hypothetical protein
MHICLLLLRFVDQDMGMRYFGGGLGHLDAPLFNDLSNLGMGDDQPQDEDELVPPAVSGNLYGALESEDESDNGSMYSEFETESNV